MMYKLRIVEFSNGKCRIQKRHWLLTLGFWITIENRIGEYYETSITKAKRDVEEYYEQMKARRNIKIHE